MAKVEIENNTDWVVFLYINNIFSKELPSKETYTTYLYGEDYNYIDVKYNLHIISRSRYETVKGPCFQLVPSSGDAKLVINHVFFSTKLKIKREL